MDEIIDFHSHLLQEIDDGSKSLDESLAMLKSEFKGGIKQVVATPHFYPQRDNPEEFLKRRENSAEKLLAAIEKEKNMPKLILGAEVYYFRGISDSEVIKKLTIDNKKGILIEMPKLMWTDAMYRELEGLYTKLGLIPIIAHVERYLGVFKNYVNLSKLLSLPVLVQANAEFFLNPLTSRKAIKMLKEEKIHLIGSDCHNLNERKPNLKKAVELIERKLGDKAISRIAFYQKKVLED